MSAKSKVLIIDDNPDFIEKAKSVLTTKGNYEVIFAYDGIEGMNKVSSEDPHIIILDVIMPNKDGYEICVQLKSDDNYKHIPIILLTAETTHLSDIQYSPEKGMEIKADAYINKPCDPDKILESVNRLLRN